MSSGATPNFGVPHISPNSANPEIAVNASLDAFDAAVKAALDDLDVGGASLPPGTEEGQILIWDTETQTYIPSNPPVALPPGGTAGQILARTANGYAWIDPPEGSGGGSLPAGGTTGQVLTKASNTDGDAVWSDPPAGGGGGGSGAAPLFSRYKISVAQTRNNYGPGWTEIAFRDRSGTVIPVTAATATRDLVPTYGIDKGHDGNSSTLFTTGNDNTIAQRWQADYKFGSAFTLGDIRITPRQDGYAQETPTIIHVYGRNDDVSDWEFYATIVPDVLTNTNSDTAIVKFSARPATAPGIASSWWSGYTPKAAQFPTLVSGGGAAPIVFDDPDVGLCFKFGDADQSDKVRAAYKDLPAGVDWEVTARVLANTPGVNYFHSGLWFRGSGSNVGWGHSTSDAHNMQVTRYANDGNGFNGAPFGLREVNLAEFLRLKYETATGRVFFYYSRDGKQFVECYNALAADLTGGPPLLIGFGQMVNNTQGFKNISLSCDYWRQSW